MAPSKKAEKGTTTTKASKTAHKAIEKPKRETKTSKKDPDAPKRPATAFFLWMNDNRSTIKQANPNMSSHQVVTYGSKVWGEMTADQKQPWIEQAAVARAAYEEQMEAYNSSKGTTSGSSKPKKASAQKQQRQQQQPMDESEEEYSDE